MAASMVEISLRGNFTKDNPCTKCVDKNSANVDCTGCTIYRTRRVIRARGW